MAPPKPKPKTTLQSFYDAVTDLTPWSSDKPTPQTGERRTTAAPKLKAVNAAKDVTLNLLDPRQSVRQFQNFLSGVKGLVTGDAFNSLATAYIGYKVKSRLAERKPADPDWYRKTILMPGQRDDFTDKQISDFMQNATKTYNAFSNNYSYVDKKTGQRVFDWNSVGHRLVENPRDVIMLASGPAEIAAASRLGTLARTGRIGPNADVISNTGKLASQIQKVSRATNLIVDPLTTAAVVGGSKAIARGVDVAKRTISNPVTSILDPDYVTAFEAYKEKTLDNLLLDEGMSLKEANQWIKQNKDNMFYSFNAENGGRFSNPYNPETTAIFEAQGKDPSAYGAPSIYNRVNQKFNRTGGPSEASLRQVTLEAAQVPSPRRSATTLQPAPSGLAQNNKNWVGSQQQNLDAQLNERMSANYPGQQLDYDAIIKPTEVRSTDPVAGSTLGREKSDMGQFVYGQDGAWYSSSGKRAGPALQPILNDQYRLQNQNPVSDTGPNISPADLDFVRRNRAASSDLGQAYSTNPTPQTFGERVIGTGKTILKPLTAGIGTFMYTGNPKIAAVAGTAAAGRDIYRGIKTGKSYLDEISGAPFNYDQSNLLVANNSLMPRGLAQGASVAVPAPVQLQPAAQQQQQRPATAAPVPAAAAMAADRNEIKMPEIKQEYTQDVTMPSGDLAPEKYDLSGFGPSQSDLKPEEYDLSQFDVPQRMYGGRAAYRAGGKVGGIEPLIQALMNKAKTAKKVSNKATEPLLNQHDNAIASALAVAQKAI